MSVKYQNRPRKSSKRRGAQGLPVVGRWDTPLKTAWAAWRRFFPRLLLAGLAAAAVTLLLGTLKNVLPLFAGAVVELLAAPLLTLGLLRFCMDALCGQRPQARQLLCAFRNPRTWAVALSLCLPAVLCDTTVRAYEALSVVLIQGLSDLNLSFPLIVVLMIAVMLAGLALEFFAYGWYPYRLGHLAYGWLTGRAETLPAAVRLSLARTKGTVGFWLKCFMVEFCIINLCFAPVFLVENARPWIVILVFFAVEAFMEPFLGLMSLSLSACYFGGPKKEFSGDGGPR